MTYSDLLKQKSKNELENFLEQEPNKKSNKYITFNHVISEDKIILATNNIKFYMKNNDCKIILVVGDNKAIYLKERQIRTGSVKLENEWPDCYFVKLDRNYFKPYTFKNDFEDMCFEKDRSFDDLKDIALSQNDTQYHVDGFLTSFKKMEEVSYNY